MLETEMVDFPGVSCPEFKTADESAVQQSEIVIGVVAFGEARAYLRSAFDLRKQHIVNDKIGSVPITIIHCDRTRNTRVLTSGKPDGDANIRCSGWLVKKSEMAIRVNNQEYAHSSQDIPLQDLPFVVTTWKEWQQAHPTSLVYMGPTIK
ncbi:MAG: DUF3179 domain-containing protein [Pirellulaceae bacterium]|nr:DUF3179 domain-containing protein [Pirellulaceae bacterium]